MTGFTLEHRVLLACHCESLRAPQSFYNRLRLLHSLCSFAMAGFTLEHRVLLACHCERVFERGNLLGTGPEYPSIYDPGITFSI
jgi:hypothetical protein